MCREKHVFSSFLARKQWHLARTLLLVDKARFSRWMACFLYVFVCFLRDFCVYSVCALCAQCVFMCVFFVCLFYVCLGVFWMLSGCILVVFCLCSVCFLFVFWFGLASSWLHAWVWRWPGILALALALAWLGRGLTWPDLAWPPGLVPASLRLLGLGLAWPGLVCIQTTTDKSDVGSAVEPVLKNYASRKRGSREL